MPSNAKPHEPLSQDLLNDTPLRIKTYFRAKYDKNMLYLKVNKENKKSSIGVECSDNKTLKLFHFKKQLDFL